MRTEPGPRSHRRRAVLGSLALAAAGAPILLGGRGASAQAKASIGTGGRVIDPTAATLLWSPDPGVDGLGAFEGIEADRAGLHPGREYVFVEDDHYRFNIYRDDRDSTGGGDRQRTESKGMVRNGSALKMRNGETWRIGYELFIPSTLHGTSRFTHIFQLKTPATNGGPWVTMSLSRSGGGEQLRLRAFSTTGAPDIARTDLAPLRDKWIAVDLTFAIGPSGTGRLVIRNGVGAGSPTVVDSGRTGVNLPDQGDYVRPKWGIYRSVGSASSDIIDTHLLARNFKAYRGT